MDGKSGEVVILLFLELAPHLHLMIQVSAANFLAAAF